MPTETVTEKATLRLELAPRTCASQAAAQVETLADKQIDKISLAANQDSENATENYIRVPFRAITATIVGGYSWKATDFSNVEALQAAVGFLVNKPAFQDHNLYTIDGIIGVIESAKWTEQNGTTPAGIDIIFKIDANKHPSLASSLTSSPPEIQSCSITVDFDWSPSHTEEYKDRDGNFKKWEFYSDLGTIANDGRMVCRKVDKIHEIYECSLVGFGADPYAKILDSNGSPINPDRASIVNLAKEGKEAFMYVKEEEGKISDEVFDEAIKEAYTRLRKMIAVVGQSESKLDLVEELAKKHIAEGQTLALALKETQEKLASLQFSLETFKVKAEKYDNHISLQKTEVIRLYKISQGNKAQEAIISLIEKADEKELQAFGLQYGANLMEQFAGNCKACGGKDIEFRSSVAEEMPIISLSISTEEYKEQYKGKSMKL